MDLSGIVSCQDKLLRLARFGTDQEGEVLYLGPTAVGALMAIRPRNVTSRDLVFQLSEPQISRRIHDAAEAAGLKGHYSGESPRVGMAMDLAEAGFDAIALMSAGHWRSPVGPSRFTRTLSRIPAGRAMALYYGRSAPASA